MTGASLHAHGTAVDIPFRTADITREALLAMFPTHLYTARPDAPYVDGFDTRLTNGARVKLQHKSRDEVHEFTARVLAWNGSRIIAVRPSSSGPRFNASEYTLKILAPALPTEPGLYVANGSDDGVVYRLSEAGFWARWDTRATVLESTTAYSVGHEVGPDGLVELVAASS